VTPSIDNSRNSIDKLLAHHSIMNKLLKLSQIIPSITFIRLDLVHPVEKTGNPLQFLVFFAGTNDLRLLLRGCEQLKQGGGGDGRRC
jgi:hypothetical protein